MLCVFPSEESYQHVTALTGAHKASVVNKAIDVSGPRTEVLEQKLYSPGRNLVQHPSSQVLVKHHEQQCRLCRICNVTPGT